MRYSIYSGGFLPPASGCRRGGMADALRSGRSPFTRVKVQVLSSAPLFLLKSSTFPRSFKDYTIVDSSPQNNVCGETSAISDGKPPVVPQTVIPSDLSTKLTVLSFLAACSVVLIHTRPRALTFVDSPANEWISTFVSRTTTTYAVPLFFAISGYLFAVKSNLGQQPHWYSITLRKRIRTLLVPYLIWCTIYAVTFIPFKIVGNYFAGRDLLFNTFLHPPLRSIMILGQIYGLDPTGVPAGLIMWYVRNLLLLFLVSPLFIPVFKKRFTAILFLIFTAGLFLFEWKLPCSTFWDYGFSLKGLFAFPLGMYFAFYPLPGNSFPVVRRMLPVCWLLSAIAHATFFFPNVPLPLDRLLYWLTNVLGIGAVWCLPDIFPSLLKLSNIRFCKDSFFLYAIHFDITEILFCNNIESFFFNRLHLPILVIYLLKFSVTLALSLFMAELSKRFLPKIYRILTGGR